ncbi:MAG TPA: alpha/beta hydrolase, partial [Thermoanaerobaculia bacterium]|nr:alpha/beta hydrolase [Thermoanaerobaculia bacterium]
KPLGYNDLLPIVLRALPHDAPFVILGESFSGPLALMAAATRPPGLRGIVLCATFVQSPLWIRWPWLRHLVRPFAFRLYPQFSQVRALVGRYATRGVRMLAEEAVAAVRPEVLAHRVRTVLQVNVIHELAACTVPILYLRGTRDCVVPAHNAREIGAIRPAVRFESIDAPHMVLQNRPAEAAGVITRFVNETIG